MNALDISLEPALAVVAYLTTTRWPKAKTKLAVQRDDVRQYIESRHWHRIDQTPMEKALDWAGYSVRWEVPQAYGYAKVRLIRRTQ